MWLGGVLPFASGPPTIRSRSPLRFPQCSHNE
jgi:hypothetical protein